MGRITKVGWISQSLTISTWFAHLLTREIPLFISFQILAKKCCDVEVSARLKMEQVVGRAKGNGSWVVSRKLAEKLQFIAEQTWERRQLLCASAVRSRAHSVLRDTLNPASAVCASFTQPLRDRYVRLSTLSNQVRVFPRAVLLPLSAIGDQNLRCGIYITFPSNIKFWLFLTIEDYSEPALNGRAAESPLSTTATIV